MSRPRSLVAPSTDPLSESNLVCDTQAAEHSPRDQLIRLLVAHLRKHPELIEVIRLGELSLSKLSLEPPPTLFNWLDEQAEQRGMDLETPSLWRALIDDWCTLDAGGELRRLCGGTRI